MLGVYLRAATLDGANFSHSDFVLAEPSKPSAAPAQPPSAADSQPASAQELLQALTSALAAQQPSQTADAQDEAAWAAHKQAWQDKFVSEEVLASLVDMQHMNAS